VVIYVFKLAIGRERPVEALIVPPRDPSFPSGHTFNAVFMIGIIVYSIFGRMHDGVGKTALITVYALYVLAMGASRIYLGVHWPSDVLGALFLGFSCLSGAVYLFGERLLPGPSPEG
jgi:undecaprenyl-diphosphatase